MYNTALKGLQVKIWSKFKVGQGHVVAQLGHIIHQSMRLDKKTLWQQFHVSIYFWSQVIGKKTVGDLEWPQMTFRGVSD